MLLVQIGATQISEVKRTLENAIIIYLESPDVPLLVVDAPLRVFLERIAHDDFFVSLNEKVS